MGKYKMKKAIFLDRDGIINKARIVKHKPYPPNNVRNTVLVEGISELLCYAQDLGFLNIVVSNQPDVARGIRSWINVQDITDYLSDKLPQIYDFYYCYHDDKDECECRKPKTGLFMSAKQDHDIDLEKSWMIGDRRSDILAGKNARCKTIFVDYDYDEQQPTNADFTVYSVKEVINIFKRELE
jgi:D-glycero-D-manno-heptose 1,7-bisphosphate phosphatase